MARAIQANITSTGGLAVLLLLAVPILTVFLLVVPEQLVPYILGAIVLVLVLFVSYRNPLFLFYFIVISSATSGLRGIEALQVGGSSMTISGLRWIFVSGIAFLFLMLIRVRVPKRLFFMVIFAVWVVIRWLIGTPSVPGLKDVLFYSTPALFGVFTYSLAHHGLGEEMLVKVEKIILYGCFIPALVYLITIPTGLVVLTPVGPVGTLIRPRAISLFLQITLAVGLATRRYGYTPAIRRLGLVVSVLSFGMIAFTLSRTASLVALLLVVLSVTNPNRRWQVIVGGLIGAVLAGYMFMTIPAFKERFFYRDVSNVAEAYQYLNTSGRTNMWTVTYAKAIEKPIMGQGLAGSRLLLEIVINKEQPPHNEYLQVFHDMGIVGVILLLLAWLSLVFDLWRRWGEAVVERDIHYARWCLASFLGLLAIMLTAITDNTMHYAFVLAPAFSVVGLAYYYASTRHWRQTQ